MLLNVDPITIAIEDIGSVDVLKETFAPRKCQLNVNGGFVSQAPLTSLIIAGFEILANRFVREGDGYTTEYS